MLRLRLRIPTLKDTGSGSDLVSMKIFTWWFSLQVPQSILPSPEFQDQEKWVAATCHKKLLQGLHRDIGRKVLSGVDLNSGKIPVELPVSFSVEADSNKWIMSNLEAKTTVHVWKW